MKGLRLRPMLLLLLLGPLVVFAPLAVWVIHRSVGQELGREVGRRGVVLARQAGVAVVDDLLTGERVAAERKLLDLKADNPEVAYLFAVDGHGRVLAHTFGGGFPAQLLGVTRRAAPGRDGLAVLLGAERLRDLSAPILGGLAGTLHVGLAAEASRRSSALILIRLSVIGLAVVASGALATLLLVRHLVRRLEGLARAARALGDGDLAARVEDRRGDEIGQLAGAFNEMATRLGAAQREQERMFDRLARSEKLVAVGRLAAGVAHEVNNPLSGSLHCLENLLHSDHDEERRREYYLLMADGISRAQKVVRHLLAFARQRPPEVRSIDLNAVVTNVVVFLGPQLDRARVATAVDLAAELPPVLADPSQIEQVVLNLLLNASEAMPGGGQCRISTRREGDRCRVRVEDRGPGVPAELRDRIFDPFFTTKPDGQGSGLGLSVSLGIAERHGGRLELVDGVSGGAAFDLLLPVAP